MERFKQAVNNLKIFPEKDSISIIEVATIMLSVSYGGAIVVMPYSIKQLGVAIFCLFLLIAVLLILYCSLAVLVSFSALDTENCDKEILRDLYPYLFEQAFGGKSRKIFLAVRNTCNITIVVSVILLAATILSDFVKVDSISKENKIRIASVFAMFLAAPLMCVGVYKDLTSAAYLVFFTSAFAVTGILIDSLIVHASNDLLVTHNESYLVFVTVDSLFSQYGILAFGLVGPTLILPNVFVFVKEKESLCKTLVVTHGVIYLLYILCGFPAYFLINGEIMPSITETLSSITSKHEMPSLFWVILTAVQFFISCHLILVSAYLMNPIYQNFESYLDIPNDFNWKRIVVRTSFMLCIAITCLMLPNFQPVLSLVGGVPLTICGIVFPLLIYIKLGQPSRINIFVATFLIIFAVIMMIGNLVVTSRELLKNIITFEKTF